MSSHSAFGFAVQRAQSLHEQTYQALRSAIVSGKFTVGERLVEAQLAQALNVSRTPIREALRQLQRENLVTPDTTGTLRVSELSIEDAVHLYDCRLALEQASVIQACDRASDADLAKIEQIVQAAEERFQDRTASLDHFQLLHLDYQFHRSIAESSKNPWLIDLLDQVFDKMVLLRQRTTAHNPNVLEVRSEHRRIYQAIAKRDRKAAIKAIQSHLNASKARVVEEIQQLEQR